jgi:hypothetical protein
VPWRTWTTPVGAHLTRDERIAKYGGAKYGGIEPSAKTPNVFVYSDPDRGEVNGYSFDGWNETLTAFLFTGEGRTGDQLMVEGNKALLDHEASGRALRVFVADGWVDNTKTRNHLYLGEFRVDPERPYVIAEGPDLAGEHRTVFVFRLLPTDGVLRRSEDRNTAGDAVSNAAAELIDLEMDSTFEFPTPGSAPTTARKREGELVQRYRAELEVQGHTIRRWRLRPPGELGSLLTDLYDETTHELYEAKGTATRDAIRRGIGQLLDYRRHIAIDDLAITVLLPHRPTDDLVDLLLSLNIGCVYEVPGGGFYRVINP